MCVRISLEILKKKILTNLVGAILKSPRRSLLCSCTLVNLGEILEKFFNLQLHCKYTNPLKKKTFFV